MNNNSKKITYVFLQGRKKRLSSNINISKEFFYTYFFAKDNFPNVNIVEMENYNNSFSQFVLRKFDSLINKLSKLPIYTYAILKRKNIKIFCESDFILLSTDRVAFSCLPLILLAKKRNKNIKISFFVMGLFSNFPNYSFQKKVRKFLINIMFKNVDKIFFLGKAEYEYAEENYSKIVNKFVFLPFSVDTEFWMPNASKNFDNKKNILFIGNDGNRDYDFVLRLAKNMSDYNFKFITEKIRDVNLPKNVSLIQGSWAIEQLTDEEIREIYDSSKITIIPLKNTNQPSGQSVALQSMSMKTPVIITKVDGFWDHSNFIANNHLIFINENNVDLWKDQIMKLYDDQEKYEHIVNNARNLIMNKYNLDVFNSEVFKSIGLVDE